MFCTNSNGTHKFTMLFVGKSKNNSFFSGLPVVLAALQVTIELVHRFKSVLRIGHQLVRVFCVLDQEVLGFYSWII